MTASSHPGTPPAPRRAEGSSTEEIPVGRTAAPIPPPPAVPTAGRTAAPADGPAAASPPTPDGPTARPAPLPAPGQRPPRPVAPGASVSVEHPLQPVPGPATGDQQVAAAQPPGAPPAATAWPPAWPDTLAEQPAPPTRTAAHTVAPTGPVDPVRGPSGAGTATPPAPTHAPTGAGRDRAALTGVGLAALAVLLLQLGLLHGAAELWSTVTLWSVFATSATVLVAMAFAARAVVARLSAGVATRVAAAGVVGLAVFWLLVILPVVASDPGFLVTAALLSSGGALWIGPRRER